MNKPAERLSPKAVIFDLGSTLIEYPSTIWEEVMIECLSAVRELLVGEGHDLPDGNEFHREFQNIREDYSRTAGETLVEWTVPQAIRRLLDKFSIIADDELVDRVFDAYYKPIVRYIYMYDDTVGTLQKIKDKGIVTGLVSNTIFPEETHINELKRFGAEPYLDFMLFSSTFGLRKPHPDIFYKAVNLAGFAPAECVYVGDRYIEDINGPNGIGMPAILRVHEARDYPDDMPETVPRIETLSQLDRHFDI
ncbi:MAG: HAD family hydrolase [candidate division Zixibacteria bacterium]|nr:HAD family hydrolase [candidate division Zixibacteria bacterium]